MKKVRFLGSLAALCLTALPALAQSPANELKIGSGVGTLGGTVNLPLTLSASDANTEGVVAVLEWDGNAGMATELTPGAAIATANTVSTRVEGNYVALGVVLDSDGTGNEVIPPGADLDLATLSIRCLGVEGSFPVNFVDGKYALRGEAPTLDNLIVQAGLSLAAEDGLVLTPGSFDCNADMADLAMSLGAGIASVGSGAAVPLTLDSPISEIQGLVAVFEWDSSAGTGEDLAAGEALAGADTISRRVEDGFMVLGVVMDSDGQDGEVIAPGTGLHLATASIRCGAAAGVFPVTFADDKYALVGEEPKLRNILVEGGLSIGVGQNLTLTNGSFECTGDVAAPIELHLGSGSADVGGVASVPLLLSSPDTPVQGLVAVFEWDVTAGGAETLTISPGAAGADTVAMRVDPGANFMALGLVVDSDGQGGEAIDPGENIEIAVAGIRCGDAEGTFAVRFVDGVHAMVGENPKLENIAVAGGLSIGQAEGLLLTEGSFECRAVEQLDELVIESSSNDPGSADRPTCGEVRVLMTNAANVEGYVTAICHDPAVLALEGIAVGAAAIDSGADFVQEELFAEGGTLGVVLDLVAPFEGNMIPPGAGQHIATYSYCCLQTPAEGEADIVTQLQFCDDTLGSPAKLNVIVVDGLSKGVDDGLIVRDGEFACRAIPVVPEEICDNGIDDDGNGDVDCDDAACVNFPACRPMAPQAFACGGDSLGPDGLPVPLQASIGSEVDVCFYIKSPEDGVPGHSQFDHIQGFSMALTFCCDILASEDFDVAGTIVESVGAEFVTAQADNDSGDGDGCELVLGVLVDALPPFDGTTIPPLEDFQKVGRVKFTVAETAACGTICDIQFTDGINGTGAVPVKNLISVENESRAPALNDCPLAIVNEQTFFRGDCNFSREEMGMAVNIADAAAGVSFLFLPGTWKFEPPCLDACDCNDDGRIDLADVMCILQYALQNGAFPPSPGPGLEITGNSNPSAVRPTGPGIDPTEDKLDCAGGVGCP